MVSYSCEKELSANELLELSISYHDPERNWPTFSDSLTIRMETPEQSDRLSSIFIDLSSNAFYLSAVRDTIQTEFILDNDNCIVRLNGREDFTQEEASTYRLSCERGAMYKNYYTYLYGLPMKLKDPGAQISQDVISKEFMGKIYDVIEVKYDPEVGSDIWYFYFDPESHAMEIYQFYKTDDKGELIPDSGEYILLEDMAVISGIKMPKVRTWYYNKNDQLLGADILQ